MGRVRESSQNPTKFMLKRDTRASRKAELGRYLSAIDWPVRTALLDFRKAFDLVDHIILVGKLHTLGVRPTAIN